MKSLNPLTLRRPPPFVMHIPHSSLVVPPSVRQQFVLKDDQLRRELLRMTDLFTDELFASPAVKSVVYPFSRLVVDPERFERDDLEAMAARGMGAVYTRTSDEGILRRNLDSSTRARLIEKYYDPHHKRLETAVAKSLRLHGWCLIIDAHSFPSEPLPYEVNQSAMRPDYCVGSDPFHTPSWLSRGLMAILRSTGNTVKLNRPFGGTLVPWRYYKTNSSVYSVMIEVNRNSYMNEATGRKTRNFAAVRRHLIAAVEGLSALMAKNLTRKAAIPPHRKNYETPFQIISTR